jgi:alkylation response protein AidB-like acyl-CoA dehydrogenase
VSVDLAFDDGQQAIRHALTHFCGDRCSAEDVKASAGQFPTALWGELSELGMLAIGTPEGEGGALEIVAAMEVLGAHVFPGPLVASFLATQVLDEEARVRIIDGDSIVSAGDGALLPWAPCADLFLKIEGERVFRAKPIGEIEPVETLGGEPWGRVVLGAGDELAGGAFGLIFADIALAAYQAAAGNALVEAASEHAAVRKQFGRSIGEFQAVAHPLTDCSMRLGAARALARRAAFEYDEDGAGRREVRAMASAAKLSANAGALAAAYVCHQVFGANGITLEGPVFHISRRIRQLASQPPGDSADRERLLSSFDMGLIGPS